MGLDTKIVILRDPEAMISLKIGFCVMAAFEIQDDRQAVLCERVPIKNEQLIGWAKPGKNLVLLSDKSTSTSNLALSCLTSNSANNVIKYKAKKLA